MLDRRATRQAGAVLYALATGIDELKKKEHESCPFLFHRISDLYPSDLWILHSVRPTVICATCIYYQIGILGLELFAFHWFFVETSIGGACPKLVNERYGVWTFTTCWQSTTSHRRYMPTQWSKALQQHHRHSILSHVSAHPDSEASIHLSIEKDIQLLRKNHMVHGDLRSSNTMANVSPTVEDESGNMRAGWAGQVLYHTQISRAYRTLAQTDDDTLAYVLLHLANAVPDHPTSRSVHLFYEDIRNLNTLDLRPLLESGEYDNAARTVLERLCTSVGPSVPMGGQSAVLNAFTSPYQGGTAALRIAIDQVINDQHLYSNGIPFVQSSGTGKSRLMVELGKHFFVLIVNLRDDDPAGSFSFPQPDIAVRQHLQEMHYPTNVAERWRLRYAALLCAIFDTFFENLGAGLPSEFAKHFETPASKSSYMVAVIQRSNQWEETFIQSYIADGGKKKCNQITSPHLIKSATHCFTKLRNVNPSKRPPPLVLALDEAHVMTKRNAGPVPASLLDIFCSVLADIKEASADWKGIIHFAAIFLSTNSQLNDVAPTVGQIESQRSRAPSLAGALACVPFDVFVDRNKTWTIGEISTLPFISTFGRPLFGALIKNDLDPLHALTLAQEKLAHARLPHSVETLTNNQTAFALLARRVLLHFRPLQSSATTMSSNLIARHLQMAFVVPKHRQFVAILFVDLKMQPSDRVVDETRFSHLMANWKNKAEDASAPHSDPYDEYAKLNTGLPTILMWNQFGSKNNRVMSRTLSHPGKAVYFIDVYGISQEVYRPITSTNQQQYRQFVGCEDMFQDAPYIFKEYQSAVERTLPIWSAKSFEQTAS